jgi:hypothetical protein
MTVNEVKTAKQMQPFLTEQCDKFSTSLKSATLLPIAEDWALEVVRLDEDEGGYYAFRYVHTVHSSCKTSSRDSYGDWRTGWPHTIFQFIEALKGTVIKASQSA